MRVLKKFLIFLLILFGLYLLHPFFLQKMADFLVVQDPLQKVDLILVLGGDSSGERVEEGVKLYKQGWANYLLMSGGPLAWKLTYARWMKKQALASGIPERAILLQDQSRSTIEDARFCLPMVLKHKFKSVLLVTSPYHTRRAARVFKKVFAKNGIRVLVKPAEKSEFNPNRWWVRHEDTGRVVWEYVSLVLYFLKGY